MNGGGEGVCVADVDVELTDVRSSLAAEIERCRLEGWQVTREGGSGAIALPWFRSHVERLVDLDQVIGRIEKRSAALSP